ncbi:hypothetical protein ZOD2009_14381 [Haladaptatus paucihalophilus DX253]|uniref:DUF2617 domain-containing protein n=1 Tax=Haladaptatus paucihalophilus DX253 TaxID=797209 RepID=E7QVP0_HALPU|nr:hypothetical protein [Haladaptatus paucihalophilus]EFW91303.1 hypothetical protein ZOD2009_14381 [Haladaptatus paucihalophilus DX253]SHL10201.1 hypothetical protein SAMN05444342_3027 [Haladaptatus paucihalophilus DX253]
MPSDTHDTDHTPTTLYFGYTSDAPDLASLDVKTVHPDTLLGRPAVFTVIGESHYVGLPELGFHELCSCTSITSETAHETPLSTAVEREFRFDGERVGATTVVEGRPMSAFPGPNAATVAYRFGPDAWTTILVGDAGYETYHTYPEHDLALYTETELIRQHEPPATPAGAANPHPTE